MICEQLAAAPFFSPNAIVIDNNTPAEFHWGGVVVAPFDTLYRPYPPRNTDISWLLDYSSLLRGPGDKVTITTCYVGIFVEEYSRYTLDAGGTIYGVPSIVVESLPSTVNAQRINDLCTSPWIVPLGSPEVPDASGTFSTRNGIAVPAVDGRSLVVSALGLLSLGLVMLKRRRKTPSARSAR